MLESECYNVTKLGKTWSTSLNLMGHIWIIKAEVKNSTLIPDTGSYIEEDQLSDFIIFFYSPLHYKVTFLYVCTN